MRTHADHSQQVIAEIRKHERPKTFPDTEEVTGSNPVRPTTPNPRSTLIRPLLNSRRHDAHRRSRARHVPDGAASAEFLAWLDAVEAECETISGHTREALRLIGHAESILAAGSQHASPDWFTWFTPIRLAAFKGNTQLKAGQTCPRPGTPCLPCWRIHRSRVTSSAPSSSATWPPSKLPSTTRSRLRLRYPSARPARPDLVRHRHGPRPGSPQDPPAERRTGLRPGPR